MEPNDEHEPALAQMDREQPEPRDDEAHSPDWEELARRGDERIAALKAARRPRLFVISGPSGVGKDTVIDRMRERFPECFFAVTVTTRARREKEIDGIHYRFMPVDEFERREAEGDFIETANVYGNRYGVLIACREVPNSITQENVLMLELVTAQLGAAISKEIIG